MPLSVTRRKEGRINIIKVTGTVDSGNMIQVKSLLNEIGKNEAKPAVVADLTELEIISSMGWGMLINSAVDFSKAGGALKFSGMNDRVDRLFWLMGVNNQIECFKELEEAVKSFN